MVYFAKRSSLVARGLATIKVAPRSAACLTRSHQMGASSYKSEATTRMTSPAPIVPMFVPAPTPTKRVSSPPAMSEYRMALPPAVSARDLRLNKSSFARRPEASTTKSFLLAAKFSAASLTAASHEVRANFSSLRTRGLVRRFLLSA